MNKELRQLSTVFAQVLQENQFAGVILLADGKGNGEYNMILDKEQLDWSTLRFIKEKKAIHVQIYKKSKPEQTEMTVNAIIVLRDLLLNQGEALIKLANQITSTVEVEETGGEFEPA